MKRATLHLELVTPCFLSGSDQSKAEWRAASVRGQLRWWFRAVAGAAFDDDLGHTERAEAAVFGSTERKSALRVTTGGAPGCWTAGAKWPLDAQPMKLTAAELAKWWGAAGHEPTLRRLRLTNKGNEFSTDPLQYLGYGCIEYLSARKSPSGQPGLYLGRPCFAPGQTAKVHLEWSPRGGSQSEQELLSLLHRTLWAWLHLGGLGSKARNGFGSVRLRSIDGELVPEAPPSPEVKTREDLERGIRQLVPAAGESGPDPWSRRWPQLGPNAKIYLGTVAQKTWFQALALAGAWTMAYRRRYGMAEDARQRGGVSIAHRDHTWAKPNAANPCEGMVDRAGFGLPLPFGKHGKTATWTEQNADRPPVDRRRASPLHLHIAHVDEGFLPVWTHLPSQFLPNGTVLAYTGHDDFTATPTDRQLRIVDHFLGDLSSKKLIREVTP